MRTLTMHLIAVAGMTLFPGIVRSQWTTVNSGTTEDLRSIFFPTANIGYVVGGTGSNGIIMRTDNQGTDWDSVFSHSTPITDIYFHDITGYAVSFDRDTIFRLATIWFPYWEKQKQNGVSPGDRPLTNIVFTDDTTGYSPGFKTTDGGQNWIRQDSSINSFPHLASDICFVNDSTGFIAGYDYWGTIYKTTNKGINWTQINIPSTVWEVYSINFPTPDIGYAAALLKIGSTYTDAILKTTDNGENWDTIFTLTGSLNSRLSCIRCTDANTCYAVGNGGVIIKTTDGGEHWFKQVSGTTAVLKKIFFTSPETGYIVGTGGTILKTTNGGGPSGILERNNHPTFTVKISPNPMHQEANIEVAGVLSKNTRFHLFDLSGRELMQQAIITTHTLIDRAEIPDGLYLYTISQGNTTMSKGKLVIQ